MTSGHGSWMTLLVKIVRLLIDKAKALLEHKPHRVLLTPHVPFGEPQKCPPYITNIHHPEILEPCVSCCSLTHSSRGEQAAKLPQKTASSFAIDRRNLR